MRRILILLGIAAAVSLTTAAAASASSIVYIKQGNVWLSSPDGSIERQVTVDGGYSSPSQADDGNIVALHNGVFVHLDRHGNLLGVPVGGAQRHERWDDVVRPARSACLARRQSDRLRRGRAVVVLGLGLQLLSADHRVRDALHRGQPVH